MIEVTNLSGKKFFVNPHQIEYIEQNPDTTLVMLSGKRLVVRDNLQETVNAVITYRKNLMQGSIKPFAECE